MAGKANMPDGRQVDELSIQAFLNLELPKATKWPCEYLYDAKLPSEQSAQAQVQQNHDTKGGPRQLPSLLAPLSTICPR